MAVKAKKAKTTEDKPKRKRGRPRKEETAAAPVKRRRRKTDWGSLMAEVEEAQIVDYDINADFNETDAIRHKTFGVGVITKILADNKIEVVFEEDKKVLAQNWN